MRNKTIGLICFIIGIVLIVLSMYVSNTVTERVGQANQRAERLTNNPLTERGGEGAQVAGGVVRERVREAANERAAPYERATFWGYILGGCLIVLGGGMFIFGSKKGS